MKTNLFQFHDVLFPGDRTRISRKVAILTKTTLRVCRDERTPDGTRLAEILKDCKQLQQTEADFMNQEWLLLLWSKFKTQIFREVEERKCMEAQAQAQAAAAPQAPTADLAAAALMQMQHNGSSGIQDMVCTTTSMDIDVPTHSGDGLNPAEMPPDALSSSATSNGLQCDAKSAATRKLSKTWKEGDRVEARDRNGDWYRSTISATSLTGKQVSTTTCVHGMASFLLANST